MLKIKKKSEKSEKKKEKKGKKETKKNRSGGARTGAAAPGQKRAPPARSLQLAEQSS